MDATGQLGLVRLAFLGSRGRSACLEHIIHDDVIVADDQPAHEREKPPVVSRGLLSYVGPLSAALWAIVCQATRGWPEREKGRPLHRLGQGAAL